MLRGPPVAPAPGLAGTARENIVYKIIWFLKRKPGITHEQFKDHYERSHSLLGRDYLGHLMVEYRRNYPTAFRGRSPNEKGELVFGPMDWEYDCITEWVMPDEAAFDAIIALLGDPVIGRIFYDDEEHFLDRAATKMVCCDTRDTGPGDGAETLRLQVAAD